jgi:succinate-semialdehyde dehydrogenase / glutarate-semialdehyde dehydrogenase
MRHSLLWMMPIDEAVKGLMLAKMRNGGAACTAANRVYVQRPVAAEFMQKFAAAMGAFVMGRGRDAGVQLGASVSVKERNKIAELVDSSIKAGAKVLTGGKTPDGPGAFYPATVLEVDKAEKSLTTKSSDQLHQSLSLIPMQKR